LRVLLRRRQGGVGGEFEPLFYCFVFYFEGWWIGMKLMERMRMRMRMRMRINENK
jgi:hypothetical protein